MPDITSTRNDRVKLARALQTQTKARRREGKIVLEGVRLLADALSRDLLPEFVLYVPDEATLNRQAFRMFRDLHDLGVPCLTVTPDVMQHVSDLDTPPGVLAVFARPELPVPENPSFVLALDGMSNPGNMGSVLRTAAAAGVDLVLLTPGTVDPFNPKVVRGGMGAQFRLPLLEADWHTIALEYGQLYAYLADAAGEMAYDVVDWLRPSLIIIGSEAHGPGQKARHIAGRTISIPMAAATESLNAAVAAGIILYEVRRQRTISDQ